MKRIPFYKHDLGQEEIDSIAAVLKGTILTTGETVAAFEERFADYLQVRHAIGVTSCTGALHLSLLAAGIGKNDEVITTPMTFIASATAILEAGAVPVFVDIENDTGNMDAGRIEAAITEQTRAILPVHLYGQMCDMSTIRRIADQNGLLIFEDAAHCVEGHRDGIRPGQLGDTASFSFYATKNLTCGEGGAVVTNNDELAQRLRLLRLHGMTKAAADREREGYSHWDMVSMGWKYNMDNIQAAMLLPQMKRLAKSWQQRQSIYRKYASRLTDIEGIVLPAIRKGTRHAHHLFPILLPPHRRDEIIESLKINGISTMVNYRAIHRLTYFQDHHGFRSGDYPVAEQFGDRILSLPFYPKMPEQDINYICDVLKQAF